MKKLLPCTALVMCAGMACAQAEERNDWHFNIGAMYGNDSNLLIVFYVQIMPDD
ncbi:hypothetical protein HEN04_009610, partial [Escherichia coli]|nr:hypothetical protein [Escherichia coli]